MVTAAVGIVAVSTAAVVAVVPGPTPVIFSVPNCRIAAVDTMASIKISFARDSSSLALDLFEGDGDWGELGSNIMQTYNNISEGCNETHQRKMTNCSHKFSGFNVEGDGMIDTYWKPFVTCNSSCPMNDPLFGINGSDIVLRVLQSFVPTAEQAKPHQAAHGKYSKQNDTGIPLTDSLSLREPNYKIPINRALFLQHIGASSVTPSTRTVFENPTVFPSVLPSQSQSIEPNGKSSTETSYTPSTLPTDSPTVVPNDSFETTITVFGEVSMELVEESFIEATLFSLSRKNSRNEDNGRKIQGIDELEITPNPEIINCVNDFSKDYTCLYVEVKIKAPPSSGINPAQAVSNVKESIVDGSYEEYLRNAGLQIIGSNLRMLWHDFLSEYFHLYSHTIGTYQ
mmetsp:Transcript_5360/g.11271  ORF Transcript_5360/g.11271 Transcript_5360/m.11271 type:complete len:398 (+) Transcript_5360:1552-2745(+)